MRYLLPLLVAAMATHAIGTEIDTINDAAALTDDSTVLIQFCTS